MDVLIVIDMQAVILDGDPKRDLDGVVARINRLAERVRERGGSVVFVQHDGSQEDGFEPETERWEILGAMDRRPEDRVVRKRLNDAFFGTSLSALLNTLGAQRLLISGWATDFCVDSTVHSAAAAGYEVVVVADCHTVSDRPHLAADRIIEHHQYVWSHLIAPRPVAIAREADL